MRCVQQGCRVQNPYLKAFAGSQRASAVQGSLTCRRQQKRQRSVKFLCYQATGTYESLEQSGPVLSQDEIVDQLKKVTIKIGECKQPESVKELLVANEDYLNPIIISAAASKLEQIIRGALRQRNRLRTKYMDVSLDEVRACYEYFWDILPRFVPELSQHGVSKVLELTVLTKKSLDLDIYIEEKSKIIEALIARASELIRKSEEFPTRLAVQLITFLAYGPKVSQEVLQEFLERLTKSHLASLEKLDVRVLFQALAYIQYTDEKVLSALYDHVCTWDSRLAARWARTLNHAATIKYRHAGLIEFVTRIDNRNLRGPYLVSQVRLVAELASVEDNDRTAVLKKVVGMIWHPKNKFGAVTYIDLMYYACVGRLPLSYLKHIHERILFRLRDEKQRAKLFRDQKSRLRWSQIFCRAWGVELAWPNELLAMCKEGRQEFVQKLEDRVREDEFVQQVYKIVQRSYPEAEIAVPISDDEMLAPITVSNDDNFVVVMPVSRDFQIINEPYDLIGTKQAEVDLLKMIGFSVLVVSQRKLEIEGKSYQAQFLKELNERLEDTFQDPFYEEVEKNEIYDVMKIEEIQQEQADREQDARNKAKGWVDFDHDKEIQDARNEEFVVRESRQRDDLYSDYFQ